MRKIGNKIFFGFGVLIAFLLILLVLNQVITRDAKANYDILQFELLPLETILGNFKNTNKEIILLALNKLDKDNNELSTIRLNEIIEVELPYFISEIERLRGTLQKEDPKYSITADIIEKTAISISQIKELNSLLVTPRDYNDQKKIGVANDKVRNELGVISFELDNSISYLQLANSNMLVNFQEELSIGLTNMSNIIFLMSGLGIIFGLLYTYKLSNSIVRPIILLEKSAEEISKGNYNEELLLKGNNELTSLSRSFNTMSKELKRSFDEINLKNKELEQFVYIASHDLQEPLRTVSNFTELLEVQSKGRLDAKARKYLQFINQGSYRMSQLVKGLLDHSRIGHDKNLSSINCNDLVKEVIQDLKQIISETDTKFIVHDLPVIEGYKTDLRLLIQNLVSNSIKFRIKLRSPEIKISVKEFDDFWQFEIEDNGIGIEEKYKEKIFSIFQRLHTQKEYSGTGIGLAHCVKIVQLHGGKIWVESKLDHGSTFFFTILKDMK